MSLGSSTRGMFDDVVYQVGWYGNSYKLLPATEQCNWSIGGPEIYEYGWCTHVASVLPRVACSLVGTVLSKTLHDAPLSD